MLRILGKQTKIMPHLESALTLSDQIDHLLPQTQCGLCGYKGCRPYAEALAEGKASINLCPPGGVETLEALGKILEQDPGPFAEEMQLKQKPTLLAVIREDECIGCTKCILACPLDAIVGAAKQMHSILDINCSGCELCIKPCPVDCIDLIALTDLSEEQKIQRQARFYDLNKQHQAREKNQLAEESLKLKSDLENLSLSIDERQNAIKAALARTKAKKDGS